MGPRNHYMLVACAWWTTCAVSRDSSVVVFGSTRRGCTSGHSDATIQKCDIRDVESDRNGGVDAEDAAGDAALPRQRGSKRAVAPAKRLTIPTCVSLASALGQDDDDTAIEPVEIVSVTAGWHHFALLTACGKLIAWGRGDYGQQGTGDTKDTPVPHCIPCEGGMESNRVGLDVKGKEINTDEKWIAIASGSEHFVGLRSDGAVLTWGWGEHGQLGPAFPHQENGLSPRIVSLHPGEGKAVDVYAGGGHTMIFVRKTEKKEVGMHGT